MCRVENTIKDIVSLTIPERKSPVGLLKFVFLLHLLSSETSKFDFFFKDFKTLAGVVAPGYIV
jgi:Flp pilus assembly protein protease CpaA